MLDHVVMIDRSGVVLDSSLAHLQQHFQFIFTGSPADYPDAVWSQPVVGGYNIIRPRVNDMEETDVNLESLFEFAFSNPEIIKSL